MFSSGGSSQQPAEDGVSSALTGFGILATNGRHLIRKFLRSSNGKKEDQRPEFVKPLSPELKRDIDFRQVKNSI